MYASDPRFGVTSTTHTATFGLTRSTAVDRTNVALRLLYGGGDLRQAGREEAWAYMTDVHPLQEWGISAGRAGRVDGRAEERLLPVDRASAGASARAGSSARTRGDQGYAITVMTEGASNQRTGIRLVEEVARRAAGGAHRRPRREPADRPGPVRAHQRRRVVDRRGRRGSGLPSSRAGEVRTTAGGNAVAAVRPAGLLARHPGGADGARRRRSTGATAPVATDLDCDGRDDLLWYGAGRRRRHALGRAPRSALPLAVDERRPATTSRSPATSTATAAATCSGTAAARAPDCALVRRTPVRSRRRCRVAGHRLRASARATSTATGATTCSGTDPGTRRRLASGTAGDAAATSTRRPSAVHGAYDPVVGDLDGDGADDIFWYGRGAARRAPAGAGRSASHGFVDGVAGARRPAPTDRWRPTATATATTRSPGTRPAPRPTTGGPGLPVVASRVDGARRSTATTCRVAGDFDGDGRGDIAWYGPGGRADRMWWGRADGGVDSAAAQRRLIGPG